MEGKNDGDPHPRSSASATYKSNNADEGEEEEDETRDRGRGGMMLTMDEQRIEPTRTLTINAADVLCGRGKLEFNHGR
jgi:hypothetical protein